MGCMQKAFLRIHTCLIVLSESKWDLWNHLWVRSSTELSCCRAQQLLPVTSCLNNEKLTAMDFQKRETIELGDAQVGCPRWGSSNAWCSVTPATRTAWPWCDKPAGHSPPWAVTQEHPLGQGREGKTTLVHGIFLLLTITFMHSSCSPAELCSLSPGKDKKVVTRPSHPERTKVVSTSIFKSALEHLLRSHLAKWMPDLHLRRQGRKSSQGCLGERWSLWRLIPNEGDQEHLIQAPHCEQEIMRSLTKEPKFS